MYSIVFNYQHFGEHFVLKVYISSGVVSVMVMVTAMAMGYSIIDLISQPSSVIYVASPIYYTYLLDR